MVTFAGPPSVPGGRLPDHPGVRRFGSPAREVTGLEGRPAIADNPGLLLNQTGWQGRACSQCHPGEQKPVGNPGRPRQPRVRTPGAAEPDMSTLLPDSLTRRADRDCISWHRPTLFAR